MKRILQISDIKCWLDSSYVDDIRLVLSLMKRNTKWCEVEKRFLKSEIKGETEENISDTRYTANELQKAMESINPDLKFVMELEEDFHNNKLPTLDTNLWISKADGKTPQIEYEFYEKPMNSKYCILEKSAMDYQSKFSILSQDLVRRLLNTKDTIVQSRKDEIVDDYTEKLFNSGYNIAQVRQIIVAGIRGYRRKVKISQETGTDLHRSAASSLASRIKKKIFVRTTWFKEKNKNKREPNISKNNKKGNSHTRQSAPEIKSVLFVPRTNGGELLRRLRKRETELAGIFGYRVKLVERAGTQIRMILCKKNPFAGQNCLRDYCMICKEGGKGDCKRRNITYKTSCDNCRKRNAAAGVKDNDENVEA